MSENLLIVFVKNDRLGMVKTRLAEHIGNEQALSVYQELLDITEKETEKVSCDLHLYFSDEINYLRWPKYEKFIQNGADIGERMLNAFQNSFDLGYERVICIGSDLPDIKSDIINKGFEAINSSNVVIGPAEDGGYYLIGMSEIIPSVFKNKGWSTEALFSQTIQELNNNNFSFQLLCKLNDIDTIDDLKKSSLAEKFKKLFD